MLIYAIIFHALNGAADVSQGNSKTYRLSFRSLFVLIIASA